MDSYHETVMVQEAIKAGGQADLRRAIYYKSVADTVRGRELLGFLATRNVLPKYSFPTDVVELKTQHVPDEVARQVELQRDLRIAIVGCRTAVFGDRFVLRGIFGSIGEE